ncbi:DUF6471 domain-containing protein [Bradyrhizobium sp.]|uniref:DUF6471 domain-containing protein n=1 Tax=Bradyrhizobium sp. TaxID=376 RepID=UPI00341E1076
MWENDYGSQTLLGGPREANPEGRIGAGRCRTRELADRLKKYGLEETEASIANRISRGTFSTTSLLALLIAIEVDTVAGRYLNRRAAMEGC